MIRTPDFIIIGAMKCATSTLHDQLARQTGIFMSEPKEPNFFSDDAHYGRGIEWYRSLFDGAARDDICGESSTHYTKRPTHPDTLARMSQHLDKVKLVYVMRHPIERLISHYVHEWTEGTMSGPIEAEIERSGHLVAYGCYAMQVRPYFTVYGRENVLPVFFERFIAEPQAELERVCRFIGYEGRPVWRGDEDPLNVSSERLRKSRLRDAIVWNPAATWLRRRFVPQSWRDRVKRLWQMNKRPRLGPDTHVRLARKFDEDLAELGGWLGIELNCATFKEAVTAGPLDFVGSGRPSSGPTSSTNSPTSLSAPPVA